MSVSIKQKTILTLLANGDFHSGTELAQALSISRAAVWKHIASLAELGLAPVAVRGKGYKLTRPLELLSLEKIQAALTPPARAALTGIELHDQIDSTNSYLMQCAKEGKQAGLVCFAEQQTAGKGRRGRQWVSPFGTNLYVSLLWRFSHANALTGLSLAIGVAVANALRSHAQVLQSPLAVGLKWPNDVLVAGRKLGGILIEVSGESDGPCSAVIGVGLNVYLPKTCAQSIEQPWTDLSQLTHKKNLARNQLAASLLNECLPLLANFEQQGLAAYLNQWREYDCLLGQAASVFVGGSPIEGIVRGVDEQGLLRLQRADGSIQTFASGEVSFRA